jgi:hypothetical protein
MEIMRASAARNFFAEYERKRMKEFENVLDGIKVNADIARAASNGERSVTINLDEEWENEALRYFRNLGYLPVYIEGHLLLTW